MVVFSSVNSYLIGYWMIIYLSFLVLSLGLSFEAHINLTLNPLLPMRHVHFLNIIVGQAAHIPQLVDIVH